MISPPPPGGETVVHADVSGFQSTYWSTWGRGGRSIGDHHHSSVVQERTSMHTTPSHEPCTDDRLDGSTRARGNGGEFMWTLSRCQRPR